MRKFLFVSFALLLAACSQNSGSVPLPTPDPTAGCPAPGTALTTIPAVQGGGASSPLEGQNVTVRGAVTADFQGGLGGLFLQDLKGDGDPATSDGIFVYTGKTPQNVAAGDVVQVTGTVKEFGGLTELDAAGAFAKCNSTAGVPPLLLEFPLQSASDLERYEGMRVSVTTPMTVTDNYGLGRYGELGLASGGRIFVPTNGQGGGDAQNALRRLVLDDGSSKQNPATVPYLGQSGTRRTGDVATNLTGVLHFANGAYKLEPTAAPSFAASNPRPVAPASVTGSADAARVLKVAGANVLNFFTTLDRKEADPGCANPVGDFDVAGKPQAPRGANSCAEFARQEAKIVAALGGLDADVVTLMEVQNGSDDALNALVAALNKAYGSDVYKAVETGTIGTDAIKVAMIYKPARVAPVGTPVVDDNADGVYSRPPLAQTFRDKVTGGVFTVVANHLKSKSSCPTLADGKTPDPNDPNADKGQGCWNVLRVRQAQKLLAFVDRLKTASRDQDVLLTGDFNAYGDEDPIQTIVKGTAGGGFVSENKRIPAAERYSYQFDGQFGYLDHALASTDLDSQVTGITEWHINADEPVVLDYNTEFKNNPNCTSGTPAGSSCTSPDLYAPNAFRASDHDPVLVGLNLKADAQP